MKTYDRKNGFLGVHFDFHASRDNRHIGKSFTEKTVHAESRLYSVLYKGSLRLCKLPHKTLKSRTRNR